MMKTSHSVLLAVLGCFSPMAHGYLSISSISSLQLTVYAIYTTSDPTCQTGLKASVPMTSTGQPIDLATTPFLGNGPVATSINCVAFVLGNKAVINWAAGTYTGSSTDQSNGGSVNPDSVCNAGGTSGTITLCNGSTLNTGDPAVVQWPTQIQTDLAANGLTNQAVGTTANGGGNATCSSTSSILVLYASTNSVCTKIQELDTQKGNGSCSLGHGGCLPTTSGSNTCGVVLTAPTSSAASYKAVFNPNYMVGGSGSNPSVCRILNPYLISFAVK